MERIIHIKIRIEADSDDFDDDKVLTGAQIKDLLYVDLCKEPFDFIVSVDEEYDK